MVNEAGNNGDNKVEGLFSPKFRSVAAMAGWDEEALLIASLVVEDTPDRLPKQKKRSDLLHFKTPPTNSRRKRRAQKRSPASITATVLDLDEDDTAKQESEKKEEAESTSIEKLDKKGAEASEEQGCSVSSSSKKIESKSIEKAETKVAEASEEQGCSISSSSAAAFPSIDRLREELCCAICLEICFEPSTTPCGHSFCKKCLRSAADKCGKKCPKCRQLISNGRSCTVNTVLWNTIQLLFPKEVETRKAAADLSGREAKRQSPVRAVATHSNITSSRTTRVLLLNSPESGPSSQERRNSRAMRRQSARASGMPSRNRDNSSRRVLPIQDEDAALALRLQRDEFMESFRTRSSADEQYRSSLALARANLRAMASRAINIRVRGSRGS
ncbi:putative E3 ubiquitin-protein ligase RING1a [Solanum dulcamara]|uniref:putative E3 ubiquitin-protein ligase RING1a n=1 Tax=Solanum dulcamara TaxID=45834 RepID=UPI0024860E11|nr:putative E3 ubiquitin-protein ligase RING1a [Solanum dulcamara]